MVALTPESCSRTPTALLDWAVAALPLAGQSESGDRYLVTPIPDGALVAVVDALGHGQDAAAAAQLAIETLQRRAHEPPVALLKRCDEDLRRTRGVVMSIARFDAPGGTMTWCGVGNIEGLLLSADRASPRQSVVLRGGVVGYRLPPLNASILSVRPGDVLVFATDGIRSDFAEAVNVTRAPQETADRILAGYGKGTDDALVLVARYLGDAP